MNLLFLLFIVVPVVEMVILIKVGSFIGVLPTIACVLATAFAGVSLLRIQGMSTLYRFNQKLSQGNLPIQEIADGMMLAFAGALLLTPGFVTDAIGFSLLIPGVRLLVAKFLASRVHVNTGMQGYRSSHDGFQSNGPQTFEGEYESHETEHPNHQISRDSDQR